MEMKENREKIAEMAKVLTAKVEAMSEKGGSAADVRELSEAAVNVARIYRIMNPA